MDAVREAGLSVILILDYGNPLYDHPLDAEGFAAYAGFMAKELRDYPIVAYEIWNEPTNFYFLKTYGGTWSGKGECPWLDRFAELIDAASAAIKEADPAATVIANPGEPQFFHMAEKHSQHLARLDGVSHHPYSVRFPPETLPLGGGDISVEDGAVCADDDHSFLSLFRRTIEHGEKHLGRRIQLFATEFGFPSYNAHPAPGWFSGYTETAQACYLARAVVLCLVAGVQSPCIYDLMNDGCMEQDAEHNFGLIRNEEQGYERKPAFFAIQRLIAHLGTAWEMVNEPPAWIDVPSEDFQKGLGWQKVLPDPFVKIDGPLLYWFQTPDRCLAILWNAGRINGEETPPHGRLIWEHAPAVSGISIEDVVTGEQLAARLEQPPSSGQYSQRIILRDLPFRSSPLIVTFEIAGSTLSRD
jgi:hypothetical protein